MGIWKVHWSFSLYHLELFPSVPFSHLITAMSMKCMSPWSWLSVLYALNVKRSNIQISDIQELERYACLIHGNNPCTDLVTTTKLLPAALIFQKLVSLLVFSSQRFKLRWWAWHNINLLPRCLFKLAIHCISIMHPITKEMCQFQSYYQCFRVVYAHSISIWSNQISVNNQE